MTALATPTAAPARRQLEPRVRPLPWRRMIWVTWRQQRTSLTGGGALLGALAVYLWVAGRQLHHDAAAALGCHPAASFPCASLIAAFNGANGFLVNGLVLQMVPALIGAFVGAPLLARELETGTFRYAWTQGFGRVRWTLAKLVALAVVVTAATGALSVLLSWYYQPYFPAGHQALAVSDKLGLFEASAFAPGLFDLRGVTFAAWTLAAFAIGALAGMLIRRVVPAIVVTLGAYAALAVATGGWLRQNYLTPLVTRTQNLPSTAWIVSQRWTTTSGKPVNQTVIEQVLTRAPAQVAGKGGIPKSSGTLQYLLQHGYVQVTSYQPVGRFWAFQWIEGGWLLALALLLIGVTVWLVRRRVI